MPFTIASSPHILVGSRVPQVMRRVLYALLPGILALYGLFGWGVLFNLGLASATALLAEAVLLTVRGKPLAPALGDYSALVTAWLLAIALPGLAPWWLPVLGTAFAIVIAKHLYGGLGFNPFNPAMIGYVVLLIAFPREMSAWPTAQQELAFTDTARLVFGGRLPSGLTLDALTGATVLNVLKTQLGQGLSVAEIRQGAAFGLLAGRHWEWVTLVFLLAGLWLVYVRAAAWQIPVAMLTSLMLLAGGMYLYDPQVNAAPWFHLFSFSSIYGAFFIATDPVTASTTPVGRLLYGAGIGVLTYLIRAFGGYPDGVAFAVLLMNITSPTLDYYTQPRRYGAR